MQIYGLIYSTPIANKKPLLFFLKACQRWLINCSFKKHWDCVGTKSMQKTTSAWRSKLFHLLKQQSILGYIKGYGRAHHWLRLKHPLIQQHLFQPRRKLNTYNSTLNYFSSYLKLSFAFFIILKKKTVTKKENLHFLEDLSKSFFMKIN